MRQLWPMRQSLELRRPFLRITPHGRDKKKQETSFRFACGAAKFCKSWKNRKMNHFYIQQWQIRIGFGVAWMATPTREAQPSPIVAIKSQGCEGNVPQGPAHVNQVKVNSIPTFPCQIRQANQLSPSQLNAIRITSAQFNSNEITTFQFKWSQGNSRSSQGKLNQLNSCQMSLRWFNSTQFKSSQFEQSQYNSIQPNSIVFLLCKGFQGFVLWVAASTSDASAKTEWDSRGLYGPQSRLWHETSK